MQAIQPLDANAAFDITVFSHLYVIYCHANATDIGQMEPELIAYSQYFNVNIISMEYPGTFFLFLFLSFLLTYFLSNLSFEKLFMICFHSLTHRLWLVQRPD
jgi:hypothetical protein